MGHDGDGSWWTKEEFIVQRILRNKIFCRRLCQKHMTNLSRVCCLNYWQEDMTLSWWHRACEYCERKILKKLLSVSNATTALHYSCAQIKRKSAKWLCRKCLRVEAWMLSFRTELLGIIIYSSSVWYILTLVHTPTFHVNVYHTLMALMLFVYYVNIITNKWYCTLN